MLRDKQINMKWHANEITVKDRDALQQKEEKELKKPRKRRI